MLDKLGKNIKKDRFLKKFIILPFSFQMFLLKSPKGTLKYIQIYITKKV